MENRPEVRIDCYKIVDEYRREGDIAKENANQNIGPSGLMGSVGMEGLRRVYLREMKDAGHEELVNLHNLGAVHIHDLGLGVETPYCAGHSLSNVLASGLKAIAVSSPANHIDSAFNHMVNYIASNSNDFSGAQAFNNIDIYIAPYAYKSYLDFKKEGCSPNIAFKLARKKVYQSVQNFMFHLNYDTRFGNQQPFSNITLAITVPEDMEDELALVGGKPLQAFYEYAIDGIRVNNHTYGDLHEWQRLVVDAFLDTYIAGDANGNGFTFPVLTLNVESDFFGHPCIDKICELTAKYGTPFFQNFINGVSGGKKMNPKDVRAMCCRLNLNLQELATHTGGIFGNSDNTGSLQVVTMSLPYIAREAGTVERFYTRLDEIMEMAKEEQLWKREKVDEAFDKGYFKLAKQNFHRRFDTFFTTIGFVGLWEAVKILNDEESFLNKDGMELAENILRFMTAKTASWTSTYGKLWNVEATPAESASYKLAKKALKQFPDIDHRGLKKAPYFTNSCHVPVEYQDDLATIIKTQNRLQTIPTGGTVTHFYNDELLSPAQVREFIKTICQTNIPYFSLSMIYSICPICGYIPGNHQFCPNEHSKEDLMELMRIEPTRVVNE